MVKSAIDIRCEASHIELTLPASIELSGEEEKALENLFFAYGKARRLCYSLRQKYELRGEMSRSEIIKRVQELTGLNSRYVKDAYATIENLPPHVTFGGLRNQRLREKGKITKAEYKKRRNSIIYARGDKTKGGNLNLRIVEVAGEKYLRVNIGDKKWLFLKLFIPDKYMKKYAQYLNGNHPYSVLIKRKDNDKGYDVRITIRVECALKEGTRLIALDMNKSHIDFCVMDKHLKNVVAVGKINTSELQNTRSEKREHQIKKVANKVKNLAKHFNADVFIGKLRTSNFKSHRKANRIVHQMPHLKLRKWIKHICVKNGVRCEERSEANTTKVGRMLSHILGLDVHKCAAIAFALKSDFHLFKLLSGVSSNEGNGSPRGRRRRGSSPTGTAQHEKRMKCWAAMMNALKLRRGEAFGGYSETPGIRGLLFTSRLKANLPFHMVNIKIW
ncbi:MAG: hypothetical protein N2V73_05905 [Candidatus Methanospirare jalkutatii]|nr:hypothetical protein [Candidatus Methanospirare jalkutatii]